MDTSSMGEMDKVGRRPASMIPLTIQGMRTRDATITLVFTLPAPSMSGTSSVLL